jgi:hypothetical protein
MYGTKKIFLIEIIDTAMFKEEKELLTFIELNGKLPLPGMLHLLAHNSECNLIELKRASRSIFSRRYVEKTNKGYKVKKSEKEKAIDET